MALSRLESADARESAARALAVACAVGYVVTLAVLFARGIGLNRWLFVLLIWTLLVYLPLRILIEALQTIAPAIRKTLIAQTASDPARYQSTESVELMVDRFFEQDVLMPRIAKPQDGMKARDGSAAVLRAVNRVPHIDLEHVSELCLGTVEQWVTELSAWAQSAAPQNIQARWAGIRALAAFAGLSKILTSATADRQGRTVTSQDRGWREARAYLDASLDYCDQLALDVDVAPWTEPSMGIAVRADDTAAIRIAWTAYAETPSPAIEARDNFVKTILTVSSQRGPSSA